MLLLSPSSSALLMKTNEAYCYENGKSCEKMQRQKIIKVISLFQCNSIFFAFFRQDVFFLHSPSCLYKWWWSLWNNFHRQLCLNFLKMWIKDDFLLKIDSGVLKSCSLFASLLFCSINKLAIDWEVERRRIVCCANDLRWIKMKCFN